MINSPKFWDTVRGVRVEDDRVVIVMKGGLEKGNLAARELCQELLVKRDYAVMNPGPNPNETPNRYNKWTPL